jgi:predicted transcriptional regulator of viral defense system
MVTPESVLYTFSVYNGVTVKQLEILDELAAAGKETFESRDVQALADMSPQAATNLLSRLVEHGLVDRVARGRYALRPLGALGTRAASEDVALAVAAAFSRRAHRIAYRSALDHHGLLEHPSRQIIVALTKPTSITNLSGRRLRPVIEVPSRISLGTVAAGHRAFVSSRERALLESAIRPELAGGVSVLASALAAASDLDAATLVALARQLGTRAGVQRLGALADALDRRDLSRALAPWVARASWTSLDPELEEDEVEWRDDAWRVLWPYSVDELEESVRR